MVLCRVLLLDGTDFETQVDQKTTTGQVVFDSVCEHLSLLEKDYFGFTYREKDKKFWLQNSKKISKQITTNIWVLTFAVKFYPPDPSRLKEELSRYLLFLQVRTDILTARLPCSFVTQALLGSYAVQSQIGDFADDEHGGGIEYLKGIQFTPGQTEEILEKIAELHKTHAGDSPAVAEFHHLENAKNIAMYGVHMHQVKDDQGTDVSIGVCAAGLLIYKDRLRTNRFSWPKILKISYKREKFFVKLRPDEVDPKAKATKIPYKLPDIPQAKQLWQLAVEHHTFFRMREAEAESRNRITRSGKYAYTGRTYYQSQQASDQIQRSGQDFNRVASTRYNSTKGLVPVTTGAVTERDEQYIAESSRTATLNVRGQQSNQYGQYDDDDDELRGNEALLQGDPNRFGVNRYGVPINPQEGYMQGQPGHYYDDDPYNQPGGDMGNRNQNGYPPKGAGGYHGPASWTGSPRTMSQASGELYPSQRPVQQQQPQRDRYGNIIIVNNYNRPPLADDDISSFNSQDDHLNEMQNRGGGGIGMEDGGWNEGGMMAAPKTTTRSYTTPNGTLVTEYRTERNGVITTRVEKRSREIVDEEEDFDYDRALAEAIGAVTDMNPDLTVEKIEIQTRTEETMA